MKETGIIIFNNDLRLRDNPALGSALSGCQNLIPLFILEDVYGEAQYWWLHHSLKSLNQSLEQLGSRLIMRRGPCAEVLNEISAEMPIHQVHYNRSYTPVGIAQEKSLESWAHKKGITCKGHKGNLLFEPGEITTLKGEPFSVYTPFWNAVHKRTVSFPLNRPDSIPPCPNVRSDHVEQWGLLDRERGWSKKLDGVWDVGERGAQERAKEFLEQDVTNYHNTRDIPGVHGTSRLSPHLHFGEISARDLWHQTLRRHPMPLNSNGLMTFLKEIVWREFCAHLLFYNPSLKVENFRQDFNFFPWRNKEQHFEAWCKGMTGYPIIDAGMRELWATGWMHNRVRMIVASFLTKNLLIDWRQGEGWFWNTLLDADEASNAANWQWVAGCGADAAPYFRIFNPNLQAEKFDPRGAYVRRWVPEISHLPDEIIHAPWKADVPTYPKPIVDLKASRDRALGAYRELKAHAHGALD